MIIRLLPLRMPFRGAEGKSRKPRRPPLDGISRDPGMETDQSRTNPWPDKQKSRIRSSVRANLPNKPKSNNAIVRDHGYMALHGQRMSKE